jgi:hypothetical protein
MTHDPMSYAIAAVSPTPSCYLRSLEGCQTVCSVAALLPTLAWSAARANALTSSSPFILRLRSQIKHAHPRLRELRLRLFGNEAGDIASDLFAMTLLQQRNRVKLLRQKSSYVVGEEASCSAACR